MTFATLLIAAAVHAADTAPPTWPAEARLMVDMRELLYDSPATTEAELLRRQRQVGVDLSWPAAEDDAGVVEYRVFHGEQERARLAGDARSWSAEVRDEPRDLTVVAIDADGNRSEALEGELWFPKPPGDGDTAMLMLLGTRGDGGSAGAGASLFADSSELHAALDAALLDGVVTGPPTISVRVGRQGDPAALFERFASFHGDHAPAWTAHDGERELSIQLSASESQGRDIWSVEVHTVPVGPDSRLSRQSMIDPLSDRSLGSCAVDTDYQTTGGLWVEVGIDPRGGAPLSICQQAAVPR